MLPGILVVLAALTLAGCGTYDFGGAVWYPHFTRTEPPRMVERPVVAAPMSHDGDAHCRAVARQRGEDAAANGIAGDLQREIFDGTYSDCMEWQARHGS
jgi:hypothetical protein